MTTPNQSVALTAGSGETIAFELLGGKKFQVIQLAGPAGHLIGTRESYIAQMPATQAALANKLHWDIFNGSGSGRTVEIHGIWVSGNADVLSANAIAFRADLFRTTSVGTGGTTILGDGTTVVPRFTNVDPNDTALPAQITGRTAPTGGAASGAFVGSGYFHVEESSTSQGYLTQHQNLVRYEQMKDMSNFIIPENTGIKLVQGPASLSGGLWGFRVAFSTY